MLLAGAALSIVALDAAAASSPTTRTKPATNIGATSATLNANVTPHGASTRASFDYGTSTAFGSTASALPDPVNPGSGAVPVSADISGLSCATTYFFRARASNRAGSTTDGTLSFRTAACSLPPAATAPSVTTAAASGVTTTSATLNASVTPNGAATTVSFSLGTTTAYGTIVAASPASIAATAGATAVTAAAGGLACGTVYHYRVTATNSVGSSNGNDGVFNTASCQAAPTAPSATTGTASNITQAGANLSGTLNPNGAVTNASFEFGTTTAYGTTVAASPASIAATAGTTLVTASIAGLACATTYHFRVKGANAAGAANGSDGTFATPACTPPPSADCSSTTVLCVPQEYATIQAAVDVARPGDTVLVADGVYTGFVVSRSGTATARLTVRAAGANAVIDKPNTLNDGIQVKNASYVTIEGFRMTNMPQFGVSARGATATAPMRGLIIRGNTSTNAGTSNFYASQVADSLLEDNVGSGAKAEHGMYVANGGSDNTIIRGNVLFDNFVNGLHCNGDSSVGGDGLQTGLVVEENTIHGNLANGVNMDGVQASTIRNNVLYANGRHGIRVYRIDASAGARAMVIANNTIVIPAASGGGAPIKLTDDGGGHTIFNNILVSDGTGGSIVVANASFASDFNVFGGSAAPAFSINGGSSMMSLAAWRAQSGRYDSSSIVSSATALFADAASGNFSLRSGAPAANLGTASLNGVAAPAVDIMGTARPRGGVPDIGAYESF